MKQLLLLFLSFFSLIYAEASDYSLIIKKPFNAALFDVTEDYDRTISAVGFSKEFKQSSDPSETYTNAFDYLESISQKHGSQMYLIKVNKSAKVILSKVAKLSRFNEAIALVKTSQNGYFVGGYTLDGELLILKLNADATPIYTKIFGTKNYDRMNNLVLLSDGGVLAVGSSTTSRSRADALFETGLGHNDIFITRFSKNGKKLWSKKYGTQYDDEGIDAVEAKDGSLLIVSKTSYDKHRDVTLMRLSENGDRLWLKHYEGESLALPTKIIRLRDDNFLLSIIQYNEMRKEHIRLIKFDLYKNILIDKEIFTTYPSGLNDIKEYSNGAILGVGYVKDRHNNDGLAMLIDSSLTMLQQEHYGSENYDNFYATKILHNSQAAVVGVHTDNESQETNMWLTKLNQDLSMAQLATNSSSFYEKLCKLFDSEIKNGTLGIREDLTIEFTDKRLYFDVGVYKLTKTQKIFLEKFSKKLLPFLLKNQEFINTLEINGHTSSEWANVNFSQQYLNNEKLSMERSFSTISYIFKQQNKKTQNWLTKVLQGSGFSYAKNVIIDNIEDKEKSRRVTFKVVLK